MSPLKRTFTALAMSFAVAMSVAPVRAITGGEADGDRHPNVGMLVFYEADGRFRCSGTLVTTTVVLTAAHCTAGTVGKTLVTFKNTIAEQPPSGIPVAGDPSTGYAGTEPWNDVTHYYGTAYAHPDYSGFTDPKNWNDVGVIVLDQPVDASVATPASIAPVGYLNAYAQPKLNKTYFRLVGYGTEVRKPDSGPQKPTPMSYPLIRRTTEANGQKLTGQIVQMNGNPNNVIAGGGTCFGDSGGPSFLNGELVTVTSYGYTANCRYIDGHQRIDIPGVQSWLAGFGVTP